MESLSAISSTRRRTQDMQNIVLCMHVSVHCHATAAIVVTMKQIVHNDGLHHTISARPLLVCLLHPTMAAAVKVAGQMLGHADHFSLPSQLPFQPLHNARRRLLDDACASLVRPVSKAHQDISTGKVWNESHTLGATRVDLAKIRDRSHTSAIAHRHVDLKGYAVEVTTLSCSSQTHIKGIHRVSRLCTQSEQSSRPFNGTPGATFQCMTRVLENISARFRDFPRPFNL